MLLGVLLDKMSGNTKLMHVVRHKLYVVLFLVGMSLLRQNTNQHWKRHLKWKQRKVIRKNKRQRIHHHHPMQLLLSL